MREQAEQPGSMLNWRPDRHLGRYRQIAQVLARHGLGALADALGLERFTGLPRRVLGQEPRAPHPSRPARLRLALEELGTTFIKLGQILSTRPDLLPPEYQAELAKLQDAAAPVPGKVAMALVAAELGRPIEECFATFDHQSLAAASIGQAHAATLPDGTEVVVKVRRPRVVEQVEEDLEILQNLAAAASRRLAIGEQYDLIGLAQEFAQTLRAELDYLREGRSAERFAANFAGDPGIHIPRVHWETTTSRVLTLERIRGIKIGDLAALDAAGIDRRALAGRAARIILKMTFEDGFFHADPHPGNFFVEPDGRLGLIDFGMVGTVDQRTRDQLVGVVFAITSQDTDQLVDVFLELGVARGPVKRDLLRRDLEHLVSRYWGRALGEIAIGPLLQEVLAIIRRHHLQLPANLALLIKTVVMEEGLGQRLDPDFQLPAVLEPYARQLLMRQFSPARWARRLGRSSLDAAQLGVELPRHLRRLLGGLERGSLEVSVRPTGLEPLLERAERLANRIVLGVIVAAFINGLAILLSVYRPLGWSGWVGGFFAVGFLVAVVVGAYLAWSIVRSGRR